jgi:hypothetical protein
LLGRVTIRLFFEMDGLTYFELNLNLIYYAYKKRG